MNHQILHIHSDSITESTLEEILNKQITIKITVREYLQMKILTDMQPRNGHFNGERYSEEMRALVYELGDKDWLPSEIADRAGMPIATVKTMLFRARKAGKIAKGSRQGTKSRIAKEKAAKKKAGAA